MLTLCAGKFFKFPGNYFAPDENSTKFDHFLLTQTHSDLIKNMDRKFSHALAKQKKVNRDASNRDTAMLDVPQVQVNLLKSTFSDSRLTVSAERLR